MQNLSTENPLVLLLELGHNLPLNWALKQQSLMTNTKYTFSIPFCLFSSIYWGAMVDWNRIAFLIQHVFIFIFIYFSQPCPAILEKWLGFFWDGCNDWKRWEEPTSVCGFEIASCLFLHSCEKNQMNALTHFPFPLPPPGPFCPNVSVKQCCSKSRKTAH